MRRFVLFLTDCGLLLAIGFSAAYARLGPETGNWLTVDALAKLVLVTMTIQASFYLFDLYDLGKTRSYRQVLVNIAMALPVAVGAVSLLAYLAPALQLGRGIFFCYVLMALVLIPLWRLVMGWSMGHPELGVNERVLILGSGELAIEVARATLERRNTGYRIVGFVDNKPELVGKSLINPSVIGLTSDIGRLVETHQVDRIVVAVQDRRGSFPTEELLNLTMSGRVAVEECARYYERLTGKIASEMLRPSWLIFSRGSRYSEIARHIRRLVNFGIAALGFVLSLPLMVLTAIAVKLESPGPIFYTQERVGKSGRRFKIIKFRSMRDDAEQSSGPVWAEEDDPRVTRVGSILRKLRLDELPQFFNVLRGDMNFVGPRPERPVFVGELTNQIPYYSQRHVVKPGLTGWAQVKYPYAASVEDTIEKLRYDLYYIKNQSLLLDAIIIFETAKIVLFGRGSR
jgi:sugar transferase (PEP-CTERM system associated)